MMLALTGADRAEAIAATVPVVARRRADLETPGDWTNPQSAADYITMLRSMEAWVEGPEWNRVVVARPRMAPTGDYWSGTTAEVLDKAVDVVDSDAGDHHTFHDGRIEQDDDSYEARVVWDRKPNLDRLYDFQRISLHPSHCSKLMTWDDECPDDADPMIAVTLDDVTYRLGWDLQYLALLVARRYPLRHRDSHAARYSRALLTLAAALRVDTVTAFRLAETIVPGRVGIHHEQNTAIEILSVAEELDMRNRRPSVVTKTVCFECGADFNKPCQDSQLGACQGAWT